MLMIAGGILLAVLVLALLPYIVESLVWLLILCVGAALLIGAFVLLQDAEIPPAVFIFSIPIIAIIILWYEIVNLGSVRNYLEYVRVSFTRASTADEVAAKARRLSELRERAKTILDYRKEQAAREEEQAARKAMSDLEAHATKVFEKFAPGVSLEWAVVEDSCADLLGRHILRIEGQPFARISVMPPSSYSIYVEEDSGWFSDGSPDAHNAREAAYRLRDIMKASLEKNPSLIEQIKGTRKAYTPPQEQESPPESLLRGLRR